jgi:hypothetical protein
MSGIPKSSLLECDLLLFRAYLVAKESTPLVVRGGMSGLPLESLLECDLLLFRGALLGEINGRLGVLRLSELAAGGSALGLALDVIGHDLQLPLLSWLLLILP